jgi:hypothetical protein
MAFNKNEVILDRVRSLTCHDLDTNEMLLRLTSLEDPSLNTTAEGEEITDAIGALITTLYRAKKATFSASNSLVSLDLAAAQYGSKKQVAGVTENVETVTDYVYETLTVTDGKITLAHVPNENTLKWVYSIEKNEVGYAYPVAAVASTKEAGLGEGGVIDVSAIEDDKGNKVFVDGKKVYVEYVYENDYAMRVVNRASEFPEAVSVVIYAYFRDVCNENKIYSGKIICPKAKLNPESVELALTSTGKHPFEFVINRDYCAEEGEDTLFEIVLAGEKN